ncbi:hypothetical protein [Cysteiniphilum sp. QT6929]|uniref:hypothetical protein n=1 Tax=Cysteiniphilum sp. QT6929 TaxID=2975055 RepID=UPI0024B3515A|nr:hypothetical protein [Cysteiniphilum sp. QT6929]WHN66486.1 hypothetical protein NYP54_04465 [Cysteiniphilum sp. QT6929]
MRKNILSKIVGLSLMACSAMAVAETNVYLAPGETDVGATVATLGDTREDAVEVVWNDIPADSGIDGMEYFKFENPLSGVLSVEKTGFQVNKTYTLNVLAVATEASADYAGQSLNKVLSIIILEDGTGTGSMENAEMFDEDPEFNNDYYTGFVKDDATTDTTIYVDAALKKKDGSGGEIPTNVTWSIVGASAEYFKIDTNGMITVKTDLPKASLGNQFYDIQVKVTDSDGDGALTKKMRIFIQDTDGSGTHTFDNLYKITGEIDSVDSTAAAGDAVGTLAVELKNP